MRGENNQKKTSEDKQQSHNNFKILEEEGGNNGMDKASEDNPAKNEKYDSMEVTHENKKLKDDTQSTMELGMDHEMTLSEIGMEDQELQEILERENLDLEKFLK